MGIFDWVTDLLHQSWSAFDRDWQAADHWHGPDHNPATGLPMTGGIDMLGNPWGIDLGAQQMDALGDAAHQRLHLDDPYSHYAGVSPMFDDWHDWDRHH
jgi:hypothetical protein